MISALLSLALLPFAPQDDERDPSPPAGPVSVERGEGLLAYEVPRDEELEFRVRIGLGVLEPAVGTVKMESGVDAYQPSLLLKPEEGEASGETPWLRISARGDYTVYTMDASIETRILEDGWPRISHRFTQTGTENRRRELQFGPKDGELVASHRRDSRKNAPRGKRVWRPAKTRTIPEGTVDMLSAVFLARNLVDGGTDELVFPLLDDLDLWQMKLRRGEERRMKVDAGTFDVVEIVIDPAPYPGEVTDEDDEETMEKFQGLFGLEGSIHLWFERSSGVPVRVQGDLPIGPITLGVDVQLRRYSGTPASFVEAAAVEASADGGKSGATER